MFIHRLHRLHRLNKAKRRSELKSRNAGTGQVCPGVCLWNPCNLWMCLLPILALTLLACNERPANQSSSGAAPQATTQPSPKTQFERDLQFIRKGQFTYVYVFSRKDGKPLDSDDGSYLRTHAPQVVDWVTTDEGKRAIGGTNFDLEQGGLPLLRQRFVVEDYTGK